MRKNHFFIHFLSVTVFSALFSVDIVAQIERPPVRRVVPEVIQSDEEIGFRPTPKCETQEWFKKKYENFGVNELIEELQTNDSTFVCYGVRHTQYFSSKRIVLQWLISQRRDEAVPQLIKLVKKGKPEISVIALDIMQYADENLLKEHRDLFLKTSTSENHIERNRSLYILQRIEDEKVEQVITKRWNAFSDQELEELSQTGSLKIMAEIMLYTAKDKALVKESILLTLREKKLTTRAWTEYFLVLRSFVLREHSTEIDQEVTRMLLTTKDPDVANSAASVLEESRTPEARNGLIQGLDRKNDTIRGAVARHLLTRSDFDIIKDQALLERMLTDKSPYVVNMTFGPITWKKPNPEQSFVIVKCLLNDLNQSKPKNPQKVQIMMRYYANLDEIQRESLKVDDATSILNAIEHAMESNTYGTITIMTTEGIFEQIHGEKKREVSYREFWKEMLER